MTKDLTEQWKRGELEEGFYFVDDGAEATIDYYLCDYWERHFDSYVQQVLAPVPNYGEWKSLNEILDSSLQTNKVLAHRLNLCKELLKRCRDFINYEVPDHCIDDVLIDKIDEALK